MLNAVCSNIIQLGEWNIEHIKWYYENNTGYGPLLWREYMHLLEYSGLWNLVIQLTLCMQGRNCTNRLDLHKHTLIQLVSVCSHVRQHRHTSTLTLPHTYPAGVNSQNLWLVLLSFSIAVGVSTISDTSKGDAAGVRDVMLCLSLGELVAWLLGSWATTGTGSEFVSSTFSVPDSWFFLSHLPSSRNINSLCNVVRLSFSASVRGPMTITLIFLSRMSRKRSWIAPSNWGIKGKQHTMKCAMYVSHGLERHQVPNYILQIITGYSMSDTHTAFYIILRNSVELDPPFANSSCSLGTSDTKLVQTREYYGVTHGDGHKGVDRPGPKRALHGFSPLREKIRLRML